MPPGDDEPDAPRRDPRASMTLITSMLERPLDPGYAAAAERREQQGLPRATSWRSPGLVAFLLVLGLAVGVAAAALRDRDGQRSQLRAGLVEQIEARQARVEEQSVRARDLQREIDTAAGVGRGGGPEAIEALRVANGAVAVRGPGLRITLDDAPDSGDDADGDPRTGTQDDGRVNSRDLQLVANGLWDSGAEAIAINGQRLTSRSAIRFAGEAILVNFRPLTRPYVLEAVGDQDAMQTAFARSSAGRYLVGLTQNYDVQTSTTTQDEIVLPSAVLTTTRYATVPSTREEDP